MTQGATKAATGIETGRGARAGRKALSALFAAVALDAWEGGSVPPSP